ncbi:hypothetical protein [Rhodococcus sp. HNM0569]|uniref:hypothetical protein n=1 Tax=Rhodococcus sp. HNM0569 TaxID=2716340 RepID=UPI00146CC0E4|nr:hypothetical protein [Rhodococcus sp. HNM0569]NLU82722.1 hypothetical protein [Rhodococcus sp. HNM0569]
MSSAVCLMTVSVSEVRGWRSGDLVITADGIEALVEFLDESGRSLENDQNVLAESWHGDAAAAAAERVVEETRLARGIGSALQEVADTYRSASSALEAVKSTVESKIAAAASSGFDVDDSGAATPAGSGVIAAEELARLESDAAAHTAAIRDALRQAGDVAADATKRIADTSDIVEDAASKAQYGSVEPDGEGEFSWKPDWPATIAGTIVSEATDKTGAALTSAAASSADDVARGIGRGLGPIGAAVGTVPAIANDINDGMDPTKAVVTEGAGTVAGILATAGTGAAVGSFAPGIGTGVGFAIGLVAGGAASWGVSKGLQKVWS